MPNKSSRILQFKRCVHVHVSGRRCPNKFSGKDMLGKKVIECKVHREDPTCADCSAMLAAFVPRKGWDDDIRSR